MMTKQYEVLRRASLSLEKHQRETKVAELLLQHHLQVSRAAFYTMMQEPVPETIKEHFELDIKKHAETGVPIQHLTGTAEFYGRDFLVNENVLIPRMETEELVQHVINEVRGRGRPKNESSRQITDKEYGSKSTHRLKPERPLTIVDVGTGSGVIAISLKLELENAEVFATDISSKALKVAKQNANQQLADITFLQGDFLNPFIKQNKKADVIVFNHPYIVVKEKSLLAYTV